MMKKTFGGLKLQGECWVIHCEPHVMLRLKRVFNRIDKKSFGTISLLATDELSRELEWFLERYPMVAAVKDKAELRRRSQRHQTREREAAEILRGLRDARPFETALPLRDYQKVACELALRTQGLLVCDELGLGKTAIAIGCFTEPTTLPALVVTLPYLQKQWAREVSRFAPALRAHILKSGQPYALADRNNADPHVIITTYHKLVGWAETLAGKVRSVTYDEVQELRSGTGTQKGAAAKHLSEAADYRIGLTATPIYNLGSEIFHILEQLKPHALGTRSEFLQEWCTAEDNRGRAAIREPEAFGTYARDAGLILRRTRQDVGRELPPLTRVVHHVDCDRKALDAVQTPATELANLILSQNPEARGAKFRAAEELSHLLRQATGIAKAAYVAEFTKMCLETGESVLLFGWHREVYAIWQELLAPYNPLMFTGTESPAAKQRAAEAFMAGQCKCLIMSLRAGAGFDGLQEKCSVLLHGELDWAQGVHEQCEGRLERDGQLKSVLSYYLVTDWGSDPIIIDTLGVKRRQLEGIRDPLGALVKRLDNKGDHVKKLAEAYLEQLSKRPPKLRSSQQELFGTTGAND